MIIPNQNWLVPESIAAAKTAQEEMAKKVVSVGALESVKCIAGVDVSNTPFDPEQLIYAAVVVLAYPSLEVLERVDQREKQIFPYIPGLLGFREIPALVRAFEKLSIVPDLIMVDGHGISHPRGLGIASHLGVLLDRPTIGVAKSILVGKVEGELGEEPGSEAPLKWKGREIGRAVRTKRRCLPLIISAGHRIGLTNSVEWVLRCLKKRRLPEPTQWAHWEANRCRKSGDESQKSIPPNAVAK